MLRDVIENILIEPERISPSDAWNAVSIGAIQRNRRFMVGLGGLGPYQRSEHWFYNSSQRRGDCQTTRKTYKTTEFVGWVVGWNLGVADISSPLSALHVHSVKPAQRA